MEATRSATRPIIVVEGSDEAVAAAVAYVRDAGWRVRPDFDRIADASTGIVRSGVVATPEDAAAALIAVLAGFGVIIAARADRDVMDRLLDDLRHVGPVEHRVIAPDSVPVLEEESRALLTRLAAGETLGEAASGLAISRRTADRRLAAARRALGVERTAEAVSRAQRLGLLR